MAKRIKFFRVRKVGRGMPVPAYNVWDKAAAYLWDKSRLGICLAAFGGVCIVFLLANFMARGISFQNFSAVFPLYVLFTGVLNFGSRINVPLLFVLSLPLYALFLYDLGSSVEYFLRSLFAGKYARSNKMPTAAAEIKLKFSSLTKNPAF